VECSAADASGNSAGMSFTVTVVDTTPPTLFAQWVPLKGKKKKGEFRVQFSAVDVCDSSPKVTGVVPTPTLDGLRIKMKRGSRVKIMFDFKKDKVEIYSPHPQAILAQLRQFGGLVVNNGQPVKVELKKRNKHGEKKQEFEFDKHGKLKIDSSSAILRVIGEDFSGITATVQVSPKFVPPYEDDDKKKKRQRNRK
jgi:hypothetical protein